MLKIYRPINFISSASKDQGPRTVCLVTQSLPWGNIFLCLQCDISVELQQT